LACVMPHEETPIMIKPIRNQMKLMITIHSPLNVGVHLQSEVGAGRAARRKNARNAVSGAPTWRPKRCQCGLMAAPFAW
jgi:hypothetical protein